VDWKQSTPPHDAGALGNRGIKQGSSQHNLKKLLGKANSGELPYLMNTTGQADVSGLAPLNEKPPLLKKRCFMRICLTCHHHTSRTRCGFFTIGVNQV